MRLNEIPVEIDRLLEVSVDEETGEVIFDTERLEELQLEFNRKMEYLLEKAADYKAMAEAIKADADRQTVRAKKALTASERIYSYIEFCLGGSTYTSDRFEVKYSKNIKTEVDKKNFVEWAKQNGRQDLLSYGEPTPNRTAIKTAIQNGEDIRYAELKTGRMIVK